MKPLPELLEREQGSITVTFYRAILTEGATIPYPEASGIPNVEIPSGTEGWFRATSERWGVFIHEPVMHISRFATHTSRLEILDEFVQVSYTLPSFYWDQKED